SCGGTQVRVRVSASVHLELGFGTEGLPRWALQYEVGYLDGGFEGVGMTITGGMRFSCERCRGISGDTSWRVRRMRSARSILRISLRSERVTKVDAVPPAPARPVRPTRWIKSSGTCGKS